MLCWCCVDFEAFEQANIKGLTKHAEKPSEENFHTFKFFNMSAKLTLSWTNQKFRSRGKRQVEKRTKFIVRYFLTKTWTRKCYTFSRGKFFSSFRQLFVRWRVDEVFLADEEESDDDQRWRWPTMKLKRWDDDETETTAMTQRWNFFDTESPYVFHLKLHFQFALSQYDKIWYCHEIRSRQLK